MDLVNCLSFLVGLLTGLVSILISILTLGIDYFSAVNSFFQYMLNKEFIEARRFIYNLPEGKVIDLSSTEEEQYNVAIVANAYTHWGLLLSHGQLPIWLFSDWRKGITAAGIAAIRLYNKLKPTIVYRRNHGNDKYAEYFENLYKKLIKKYPNYTNYTG